MAREIGNKHYQKRTSDGPRKPGESSYNNWQPRGQGPRQDDRSIPMLSRGGHTARDSHGRGGANYRPRPGQTDPQPHRKRNDVSPRALAHTSQMESKKDIDNTRVRNSMRTGDSYSPGRHDRHDHSPGRYDTLSSRHESPSSRLEPSPVRHEHSPSRHEHSPSRHDHSPNRHEHSSRHEIASRQDHSPSRHEQSSRHEHSPSRHEHSSRQHESRHHEPRSGHHESPSGRHDQSPGRHEPSRRHEPPPRHEPSVRPRQLPQPGECRRKSEGGRPVYRGPMPSSRSPRSSEPSDAASRSQIHKEPSPNDASMSRSQIRKDTSPSDALSRSQIRKDTSPRRSGINDTSPSRRSDDGGEEYRTPPDRSPNFNRDRDEAYKTPPDRSPNRNIDSTYQSDKSPIRSGDEAYRTPPDRSPNRTSEYLRYPADSGQSRHKREPSDPSRKSDTSPGRTSDKEPSKSLHPNDQPSSALSLPTQGRRRSSSGQRLERQAAIVRERIEMRPEDIVLHNEDSSRVYKSGMTSFLLILFSIGL